MTGAAEACPECARLRRELAEADTYAADLRRQADRNWQSAEDAHEARHEAQTELDAWRIWAELHFPFALAHLGDDTMRAAILTEVGR